jgi:hypothetical protein
MERQCDFCFDAYMPTKRSDRFCCALCREEFLAGTRRAKVFDHASAVRSCKNCEAFFIPNDPREQHCSQSCTKKYGDRIRQLSGRSAAAQATYRSRHSDRIAACSKKYAVARYQRIKADPIAYAEWRSDLSRYNDPAKKAAAQRRRHAERAMSILLLPTQTPPELDQ